MFAFFLLVVLFWEATSAPTTQNLTTNTYPRVVVWGNRSIQPLTTQRTRPKKPQAKVDLVPGVGEVLQDRFNPKPYFKYEEIPPKSPVYKPPDSYSSPFTSYNPPNMKPIDTNPPASEDYDSKTPPSDAVVKPSLGPPLADLPPFEAHSQPEDNILTPPQDTMLSPPQDTMLSPPQDAPPSQDNILTPPQEQARFPQYLYDPPYDYGHDHDHHVYHEVEHTTKAKEEGERVSKDHYSYYFLGRKLWYVPLYFSIYFVIYITVLILKSIARHKIEFKHHFERKARSVQDSLDELHYNVTNSIDSMLRKYQ